MTGGEASGRGTGGFELISWVVADGEQWEMNLEPLAEPRASTVERGEVWNPWGQ